MKTKTHARQPNSPTSDNAAPAIATGDRGSLLSANRPKARPRGARTHVRMQTSGTHTVANDRTPKFIAKVAASGSLGSVVIGEATDTVPRPDWSRTVGGAFQGEPRSRSACSLNPGKVMAGCAFPEVRNGSGADCHSSAGSGHANTGARMRACDGYRPGSPAVVFEPPGTPPTLHDVLLVSRRVSCAAIARRAIPEWAFAVGEENFARESPER